MPSVEITKKAFWIPVQLTSAGYVRVEAYSPEDALDMVQSGDFNPAEGIGMELESFAVTGPPTIEGMN
jgi:hypothetical protein